ncbi:MAG: tyrosine-type recombinase/integrase [Pyrinomonadaceae bacterium]
MTIRNRGTGKQKRWYYDFSIRGVRYKGSLPEARTKDEAFQAENKIKKDVYEGRYEMFSGEQSFTEFVRTRYVAYAERNSKWAHHNRSIVKTICRFFDKKTFREITRGSVREFRDSRQDSFTRSGKRRAPSTVNRELAVLSKILSLAVEADIIEYNPCSTIEKYYLRLNNERVRYLSEDEEKRLMEALANNPFLKNIVVTAIFTGLRRGEIFSMKWEDVDLNLKFIRVLDKNGEFKSIPIGRTMLRVFESLSKDNELVFPSPRTGRRLTDVKKGFREACQKAGIKNFRFHDLRHTTATRLGENGFDLHVIGGVLGHKDARSTKRYAHITNRSKIRAIDSLEREDGENVPNPSQNAQRQVRTLA